MKAIRAGFRERCREITRYLDLLRFVEETGSDVVSPDRKRYFPIDVATRHVLKASVFIHLYNLIESVVAQSLERVAQEIHDGKLTFAEISKEWQRCWVQELAKTAEPLNPVNRLTALLTMCDRLLAQDPVVVKPRVPGGSLDDARIEKLLRHHGIHLSMSPRFTVAVRHHVVDLNGPLKVVRIRRNDLAHGLASFGDCGRDVTILQLRQWAAIVFWYLRQVIMQFGQHLAAGDFKRRTTA